jgi:predicted ATP-grasp superfamily ATP-dependent carboligase
MHNAIVLGGHTTALYAVRSFGRANIKVAVVDTVGACEARFSRYCSLFSRIERFEPQALLAKITDVAQQLGSCAIIPTSDSAVRSLSEVFDVLAADHVPLIPPWRITEAAYDKRLTYEMAERCGIPIPLTRFPGSVAAAKEFARELRFPLVIKPTTTARFRSVVGKKALLASNIDDLAAKYRNLSAVIPPAEILMQEFIKGTNRHFWHYGAVFHDGAPYFDYVISRKRQYPIDFGTATHAEIVPVPEVADFGARILREMGFWGPAEVQFKFDEESGRYVLLDVNPRLWKSCAIADLLGVSMPMLAYQLRVGQRPPIPLRESNERLIWRDFLPDLVVALREMLARNLTVGDWLESYRGRLIDGTFARDDFMPGVVLTLLAPWLYLRGMT